MEFVLYNYYLAFLLQLLIENHTLLPPTLAITCEQRVRRRHDAALERARREPRLERSQPVDDPRVTFSSKQARLQKK